MFFRPLIFNHESIVLFEQKDGIQIHYQPGKPPTKPLVHWWGAMIQVDGGRYVFFLSLSRIHEFHDGFDLVVHQKLNGTLPTDL